ncbi:hypothetical protein CBM2637_A30034 [Cupriavidus taiwanensis]|nr:hypothetical protein CBM2637_A30034 [Cupriavidus taiwanensis]
MFVTGNPEGQSPNSAVVTRRGQANRAIALKAGVPIAHGYIAAISRIQQAETRYWPAQR